MDINDFFAAVAPQHQDFVRTAHEKLIEKGCKMRIESKASGLFVSYSHPKTKRSLLNFLFRKSGLFTRLYSDNINNSIINSLPASMEKEINKALDCRLCSDKCPKGYKFSMRGQAYNKCRYNAFLFAVTEESKGVLTEWIQKELSY